MSKKHPAALLTIYFLRFRPMILLHRTVFLACISMDFLSLKGFLIHGR